MNVLTLLYKLFELNVLQYGLGLRANDKIHVCLPEYPTSTRFLVHFSGKWLQKTFQDFGEKHKFTRGEGTLHS